MSLVEIENKENVGDEIGGKPVGLAKGGEGAI